LAEASPGENPEVDHSPSQDELDHRPWASDVDAASTSEVPEELDLDTPDLPGALFGYDRYTTVRLVDTFRERIQALTRERKERDQRIMELELEVVRAREGQRMIGETLIAAREEAQRIREEARRSAQELLRSVRKQATRILEEAELTASARAQELVETADRKRKLLLFEAERAKAFIEQTHEQLSEFLLAAVKWYEEAKPSRGNDAEADVAQPDPRAELQLSDGQPPAELPSEEPNEPSKDPSWIPSA
jgi:cell division initiation protein